MNILAFILAGGALILAARFFAAARRRDEFMAFEQAFGIVLVILAMSLIVLGVLA
jgi:hypothetical protein